MLQLKIQGFQHIDALDPSEGMLEKAKSRNLYDRYICDYITDKQLDILESKCPYTCTWQKKWYCLIEWENCLNAKALMMILRRYLTSCLPNI